MFGLFKKPMNKLVCDLMELQDRQYAYVRAVDSNFSEMYITASYVASISTIMITSADKCAVFWSSWRKHVLDIYSSHNRGLSRETIDDHFVNNCPIYVRRFKNYLEQKDAASDFSELLLQNCGVVIPDKSDIVYLESFIPFIMATTSLSCDVLSTVHKYSNSL